MTTTFNVRTATMAQLVAFFNANTGGNPVKKFSDRPTAEKRVQKLVDEIAAEESTGSYLEEFANASISGADFNDASDIAEEALADDGSVFAFSVHGQTHCKHCGIHLGNGVGEHDQEVNGKLIKHTKYEFECLGCGNEFGPAISAKSHPTAHKVGPRPEMVKSLKIDRRIVDMLTGDEYANACQVWKAGLVSASQGDRLSAVLYGSFKKTGKRDTVCKINGRSFRLAF